MIADRASAASSGSEESDAHKAIEKLFETPQAREVARSFFNVSSQVLRLVQQCKKPPSEKLRRVVQQGRLVSESIDFWASQPDDSSSRQMISEMRAYLDNARRLLGVTPHRESKRAETPRT
ncbi:MAG: hypothetical protein U0165_03560 [Polyangiaceae bacterium]